MDALFGLIEHMQINLYLQIESLAYSTCYLLLTNKKVVQYAESCGFREMLLDKMLRVNEDHHTYMVQYLIGLMDAHG